MMGRETSNTGVKGKIKVNKTDVAYPMSQSTRSSKPHTLMLGTNETPKSDPNPVVTPLQQGEEEDLYESINHKLGDLTLEEDSESSSGLSEVIVNHEESPAVLESQTQAQTQYVGKNHMIELRYRSDKSGGSIPNTQSSSHPPSEQPLGYNSTPLPTSATPKTWKTVYGSSPSSSIAKGIVHKFCCSCNRACSIRWWSYLIGLLFFFLFGTLGAALVRLMVYLCTGTIIYSIGKLTVTSKIPSVGDFIMVVIIGGSGTVVFLLTKYIFKEWMDKLTLFVIALYTEKSTHTKAQKRGNDLEVVTPSNRSPYMQNFHPPDGSWSVDTEEDSLSSDEISLSSSV